MDFSPIFALAAVIVGLAKGGIGPFGGLLAPLLSTIMPVSQVMGLVLPLLMVGDVFALRAYWRDWEMRHLRLLLPAAVVGVVAGAFLLTTLPDRTLRHILGVLTLLVVAYKLANDLIRSLSYRPHNWHGYLAGGAAGFSSALANAGGPPVTAYLLLQKLPPAKFIGTSVLFFALVNVVKMAIFLSTGVVNIGDLSEVLWVLPIIPLGVWAGRWLITRMNRRIFEGFILLTLIYAGISLLLK